MNLLCRESKARYTLFIVLSYVHKYMPFNFYLLIYIKFHALKAIKENIKNMY